MVIFKTIRNTLNLKLLVFLALIFLFGCKEPFEPNLPSVAQGYPVAEGFINAQGLMQIQLSRSTTLEQKTTFNTNTLRSYIPPGWFFAALYEIVPPGITIITHYLVAPRECVDCREIGGINIWPSFW